MIGVSVDRKEIKNAVDIKDKMHKCQIHNKKVLAQPRKKFLEKAKDDVKYNFRRYFNIHIFNFNTEPVIPGQCKEAVEIMLEKAKKLVGG